MQTDARIGDKLIDINNRAIKTEERIIKQVKIQWLRSLLETFRKMFFFGSL